ncbi:MAG: extracellular solute-binding protein [Clostridia bacterium]|nr:extracellular solute-binding protein [Clostridia bacterium]
MKKTGFMRVLILLMAFCMLVVPLVSCGEEEQEDGYVTEATDEIPTEEPTEDPAYIEDLPEVNYAGETFKMQLRDNDLFIKDMYVSSYSEAVSEVDRAVFIRNEAVSERLGGIDYEMVRSSSENNDTSLMSAILSGSCNFDLIINHGHSMTNYAQQAALENFYDLPYLDLTKHYWDQNLIEDFAIKGQLYVLSGDISYLLLGHTDSMVFNKSLCDRLNLDYPYESVVKGEWTFELFTKMIKESNSDVNSNGVMLPSEGDYMGYVTDKYCGPLNVLYSGGSKVSQNDGETFSLSLYTDRHDSIFQKFFELMEQDNCMIYTDWNSSTELVKFRNEFANGNVLFTDLRTYEIEDLIRAGMLDYGVIPWPKWDDTVDQYYSWVDAGTNLMGVPAGRTEERLEFISVVLEALCAEGSRNVMPMYYERILKLKLAQDPQSHEIMDMIKEGRVYDMASYWRSPVGMPGNALVSWSGHNFTTWWESNRGPAESHVKTLNELFDRLAAK